MKLGLPVKPVVDNNKDQKDINKDLYASIFYSLLPLYRILQNNITFKDNISCYSEDNIKIKHKQVLTIPHNRNIQYTQLRTTSNKEVSCSLTLTSSNSCSLTFCLPTGVILAITDNKSVNITNPQLFNINDVIILNNSELRIKSIVKSLITFDKEFSLQIVSLYDIVYLKEASVNIILF